MRRRSRLAAAALLAVLLTVVGCSSGSSKATYATVTIGSLTYRVEMARTAEEQREGLSSRQNLADGTGMLFQFGSRREQQVWMAGMAVALDIAWIADDKILAIDTLGPCQALDQTACPRWTSPAPVDALLEVPAYSLKPAVPGMDVLVEQ